jgi:hypothetical protein
MPLESMRALSQPYDAASSGVLPNGTLPDGSGTQLTPLIFVATNLSGLWDIQDQDTVCAGPSPASTDSLMWVGSWNGTEYLFDSWLNRPRGSQGFQCGGEFEWCVPFKNPENGYRHWDNILWAWKSIFQVGGGASAGPESPGLACGGRTLAAHPGLPAEGAVPLESAWRGEWRGGGATVLTCCSVPGCAAAQVMTLTDWSNMMYDAMNGTSIWIFPLFWAMVRGGRR